MDTPLTARFDSRRGITGRNPIDTKNISFPDFEELAFNVSMSRQSLIDMYLDPRRDYNKECGYPETQAISKELYRQLYDREAVARRVVQLYAWESWQVQPTIFEDEDPEVETPFEKAWDELGQTLNGKSWFQSEEGSPIWEHLKRADELSGIGTFGVILLGIDDGKSLDRPVDGVEPEATTASQFSGSQGTDRQYTGEGVYFGSSLFDRQDMNVGGKAMSQDSFGQGSGQDWDAQSAIGYDDKPKNGKAKNNGDTAGKQKRKLLFLRCFDESLVQISQYERRPTSPRFGQPVMYLITFNDPREQHTGVGLPLATAHVHWSRVIHLADNLGSSECFGAPRMRPVYNRLMDLIKLYGGSAEMYWRGAFPGISLETHPQLGGDVNVDAEGTRNNMFDYMNGLQRYLLLMGMSAKTLAPTVVDPTPQINTQIEAICIELDCPKRVFMGSERGELASTQDDAAWNDRLKHRQEFYVTPRIIVPFVNRLIMIGVLPEPKGFSVVWPDLTALSDSEKAAIAVQLTTALTTYVAGNGEAMMEPIDFMTRILPFTDEEANAMIEATVKHLKKSNPDTEDKTVMPGHMPSPPKQEMPPMIPIKTKEGETLMNPQTGQPLNGKQPPPQNGAKPNPFAKKPTANADPGYATRGLVTHGGPGSGRYQKGSGPADVHPPLHPNLIEYATRELFKGKSLTSVSKAVAKKFDGSDNVFLGGHVSVTPQQLEHALLTDKAKEAMRFLGQLKPELSHEKKMEIAVGGTADRFNIPEEKLLPFVEHALAQAK